MSKYTTIPEEGEDLPNKLGITDEEELHAAEFEGFLTAEILFTERLTPRTRFTVEYIREIHRVALERLYAFAGRFRTVNLSKGGFVFPAARFIPESMAAFEREFLLPLPDRYPGQESLVRDIARVHGELLFIHPFREGNGRTARILANLMARKQGHPGLNFEHIDFNEYVIAVQQSARRDYSRMEKIIASAF